ncbi:MAG: copper ion binding protein [Oscillospiraceae bacterium]|jgi:copper chaperone|nr:copper ion binding protein [Oscillospiraceae bacterium]
MTKTVIKVGGMTCKHCVKAVTDAVGAVPGVEKVKVSLRANTATVQYDADKTTLDAIHAAIKEEEYDVL